MSDAATIQALDFSTNLLRALLWQHNTAGRLEALVRAKDQWYQANQRDFWTNWIKDVFDLRTCNAFGMQVWSRILGIPLQVALSPTNPTKPAWGFANADTMPAFARASGATYRAPTTLLLTTVGNNVARYQGANKSGLLIESAATNLYTYSEDYTQWTANSAPTLTKNITGPDGVANSAFTIVGTTNTAGIWKSAGAMALGDPVTYSHHLSAPAAGNLVRLRFEGGAHPSLPSMVVDPYLGTIISRSALITSWRIERFANGFFRISATALAEAAGTSQMTVYAQLAAGATWYMFGSQVEKQAGMSSYIKTTGAAATRAADIPGVTTTANKNFNHGGFSNAKGGTVGLTVEQQRILLRLRYYQLISRCTVPDINRICKAVFSSLGTVYVLDGNDMSYVIYVFDFSPGSQLSFLLQQYDLLPRPAGVGVKYTIITRPVFGFSNFNKNFNNGTFAKDTK